MMPDGGTQTGTNDISNLAGGILRSLRTTPVVLHVTHCVGSCRANPIIRHEQCRLITYTALTHTHNMQEHTHKGIYKHTQQAVTVTCT